MHQCIQRIHKQATWPIRGGLQPNAPIPLRSCACVMSNNRYIQVAITSNYALLLVNVGYGVWWSRGSCTHLMGMNYCISYCMCMQMWDGCRIIMVMMLNLIKLYLFQTWTAAPIALYIKPGKVGCSRHQRARKTQEQHENLNLSDLGFHGR